MYWRNEHCPYSKVLYKYIQTIKESAGYQIPEINYPKCISYLYIYILNLLNYLPATPKCPLVHGGQSFQGDFKEISATE